MTDEINHPNHYTAGGIEVIDFIEAWQLGFNLGNVVKYVARAGHKTTPLVDLKKAAWYLAREITGRETAVQALQEVSVERKPDEVRMEFKVGDWQQAGPDDRNFLEKKIRDLLRERGGTMHLRTIAKAIGLPAKPEHVRYRSFTTFMSRLSRRGVIHRSRRGFYESNR